MLSIKNTFVTHIVLALLLCNHTIAQTSNEPPVIMAIGNQIYCPLSQINVVTDFDIVDPDDTSIEAIYIQISTGYVFGEDSLILTGSHPNITKSWSDTEGKLTLTGTGSVQPTYVDLIAAVKDVVFQSTNPNPTNKSFSFTIGDANYLPTTGHFYEYVSDIGITWTEAKAAAELKTYYGLQGYLATILYPEEAQLAGEQAAGAGWIGGSDAETEGVWKWVTGPEVGTIFWNGGANGTTPNYANWNTGEPNNCCGGEDYAHVTYNVGITGSWNDLPNEGDSSGDYQPKGYIVEYGGMPGDPALNISASTQIQVNAITNVTNASNCGPGSVTLQATPLYGTVLWFDAPTGGNVIYDGLDFTTPVLNATTTTYYVLASANGCMEGIRTPVVATINNLPIIQPSIVFKNCDEDGLADGFTDFNLEEANTIISNNNTTGLTFSYYATYDDANSGNSALSIIYNNALGNIVYARVENADGCYRIATINLQVSTTEIPDGVLEELDTCDDDQIDGFHTFDLTQASNTFIALFPSEQNLSVHYYRTLNDAELEQNEILNQSNFINETVFSQVLYVRIESDDNGACFGIGPHVLLTVNPRPEFEVGQSNIFCNDNEPVTLYTFNASDDFTYQWMDESGQLISNSPTASISSGGTYTVLATSVLGCESFPVSFTVVESAIADIGMDDISIVELSDNNSITINTDNLGIGDYVFALDDINGPYQSQPYFDGLKAGNHWLYVKDNNLCGTAQLEVFILGFPKFFSPNNDGYNDTWQVQGVGTDFTNDSFVNIYDRYGKLIKQINAKNGSWDGTFNGQKLAASDYWFEAQLVGLTGSIKTYRGHFSLVR